MVDYTLSDGDNVVISENTTVEDFYYEGGKIKVMPNVAFFKTGDFIFKATSSDDALGHLYGALVCRTALETGYSGAFTGFYIYDTMPDTSPLFFPAVVFDLGEAQEEIVADFFGGEWMENGRIVCDLAFKMDKHVNVEGTLLNKKELAEHYLWYMRQILSDMTFESDHIKVGSVYIDSSIQEPLAPNQTLYGFSLEIGIDYKKEAYAT